MSEYSVYLCHVPNAVRSHQTVYFGNGNQLLIPFIDHLSPFKVGILLLVPPLCLGSESQWFRVRDGAIISHKHASVSIDRRQTNLMAKNIAVFFACFVNTSGQNVFIP